MEGERRSAGAPARSTDRLRGAALLAAAAAAFACGALLGGAPSRLTAPSVAGAEALAGLTFTEVQRDSMLDALGDQLKNYESIRRFPLPNSVPPAFLFDPIPPGWRMPRGGRGFRPGAVKAPANLPANLPAHLEELAFASVGELGALIRSRAVTSEALTKMYIARLKRYDPMLHCVVTLTEERALGEARAADAEIAAGRYRGPLHGIPYGAKDLLATKGIPTTWGSAAFRTQVPQEDAAVIRRLHDAGAVLVAKFSLGELAMGDVWFGGMTRTPWDTSRGSSGSSAGSASATAAGLVAFSVGSETWGSIVSPSTACGTTGLRPTFGRVSRAGAMALSWTMDKLGPICRSARDCALVFDAMIGRDDLDPSTVDAPFNYTPSVDFRKLTIGYLHADFDSLTGAERSLDSATLALLRSLGATLRPIELPRAVPTSDLAIILTAEAAAAFDDLTRSGRDTLLVRQIKDAWPNIFRAARFIPAVEYIQASRLRTELVRAMDTLMRGIDCYVAPSFEGDDLLLTNLTGHPCVVIPNGFTPAGLPRSISFIGRLYDEATILAVAGKVEEATPSRLRRPPLTAR